MFNNVGHPIEAFAVVKCEPNKTPEVVSEHQCIGNACEEQMVLNEMAEGTDVTFVVKETCPPFLPVSPFPPCFYISNMHSGPFRARLLLSVTLSYVILHF